MGYVNLARACLPSKDVLPEMHGMAMTKRLCDWVLMGCHNSQAMAVVVRQYTPGC